MVFNVENIQAVADEFLEKGDGNYRKACRTAPQEVSEHRWKGVRN